MPDWPRHAGNRPFTVNDDTQILPAPDHGPPHSPRVGSCWGSYRLIRRLGQGGMGTVYEAEEVDSGRRIALKTLDRAFDSPEARARFLREGRLAAAINHPHSVYVYGTEEIAGTPVIAMELMAGGTLADEVARNGPLPTQRAVDALLQVVDGLEAAQHQGILHRDIKPSNCFVDADGTIKIGDFGLSISLVTSQESTLTKSGAFLGTPAFSSPEQLRGQELTVRSDIYAVGLTLYFLLTGRLPFEAPNPVQLLATILERPAKSPVNYRPELPRGLCQVVLRCLEKDPAHRFRDYADLRSSLSMYASAAPLPAPLGLRSIAGIADQVLLSSAQSLSTFLWLGGWQEVVRPDVYEQPKLVYALLMNLAMATLYFGLLEGLQGASLGKRLCGLRVRQAKAGAVHLRQAGGRGFLYGLSFLLPSIVFWCVCQLSLLYEPQRWATLISLTPFFFTLLLFATARRSNGYAALHDLATETRVVLASTGLIASRVTLQERAPLTTEGLLGLGPYHVLHSLAEASGRSLIAGYDSRLQRRVWIHQQPAATAPVPMENRRLSRPGRLRWLGGQRTAELAWDAYEGLEGRPFLERMRSRPDWSTLQGWLLDLAVELQTAQQDGSLPEGLSLSRIWITEGERAKLLDFSIPGLRPEPTPRVEPEETVTPLRLLNQVAGSALAGRAADLGSVLENPGGTPLPLHARGLLQQLASGVALGDLLQQLQADRHKPATLTRSRRLAVWLALILVPALSLAVGVGALTGLQRMYRAHPQFAALQVCLRTHTSLEAQITAGQTHLASTRDAFEVYVSSHFRSVITNDAVWKSWAGVMALASPYRRQAERIVEGRPAASLEVVEQSVAAVEAWFKMPPEQYALNQIGQLQPLTLGLAFAYLWTLMVVVLPCWLASLLFRGGACFWLSGMAVVTREGRPASRARVLWRNVIAWAPFVVITPPSAGHPWVSLVGFAILAVVAFITAARPTRSLPDRLAGTHLVPR